MTAMQSEINRLWQVARTIEKGQDPHRIRQAYEAILALDALQPAAWLKLSQLSLHGGDYRDARNAALRAAEATKLSGRWRALPYVTMQLLHFDERVLVSDLIGSADWSNEAVLAQSAVLAQRLWLADAADAALRLLDHAMRLLPAHYLLHFSRGEVLNHLGRLEDAKAEYERCIELEPAYPHAYLSLTRNRRSRFPDERVRRIRSALAAAGSTEDRVVLSYALFHELDAIGDVEAAWAALESGARMQRTFAQHDAATARGNLRELLAAFEGVQPLRREHAPHTPRQGHIFVVGLPRSGTTLLERMFGNHPQVGAAGELNAFSRSMSWEINTYYEPPPEPSVVRFARDCDLSEVGKRYAEATSTSHPDKPYLLDKNPLNIYNAGYIAQALPQARIICLSRNPMDACFSNMKELFAPGSYEYSYDQRDLAEHFAGFRALTACWQQYLPEHFHMVEYEALVSHPERELARALKFCGLEFDPTYVDILRNQSPVSTASSAQVREPLNTRGMHAWQKYQQQLQPLASRLLELGIEVE